MSHEPLLVAFVTPTAQPPSPVTLGPSPPHGWRLHRPWPLRAVMTTSGEGDRERWKKKKRERETGRPTWKRDSNNGVRRGSGASGPTGARVEWPMEFCWGFGADRREGQVVDRALLGLRGRQKRVDWPMELYRGFGVGGREGRVVDGASLGLRSRRERGLMGERASGPVELCLHVHGWR